MATKDKDPNKLTSRPGRPNPTPNVRPDSPLANDLPVGARPGQPAPNVSPGERPSASGPDIVRRPGPGASRRPTAEAEAHGTARDVGESARKAREQARQSAGEMADSLRDVSEEASHLMEEVQGWIGRRAQDRPIAVVLGAAAAGWVVAAGLPRWLVRLTARAGVPLALTALVARTLSERRFEPKMQEREPERPPSRIITP